MSDPLSDSPQVLQAMLAELDPNRVLPPGDAGVDSIGRSLREGLIGLESALPLGRQGFNPARYTWLRLTEAASGTDVQRIAARGAAAWTAQWALGGEALIVIGASSSGVPDVAVALEGSGSALWLSDLAPDLLWEPGAPESLRVASASFESVLYPRPMGRSERRGSADEAVPSISRLLSLSLPDWLVVVRLRSVDRQSVGGAQQAVVRLQRDIGRRLNSSASVAHNETTAVEDPQVKAILEALDAWQAHLRSCSSGGAWQTSVHCMATSMSDLSVVEAAASTLLGSAAAGAEGTEQWWGAQPVHAGAQFGDCTGWLSADDLGALLIPPRDALGSIQVRRSLPAGRRRSVATRPIELGFWLGTSLPAVIDVDDLAGHAFIAGITGSGKSTTTARLLTSLWNDHGIPFLVIDPAKADYEGVAPHLDGGLRVLSGEDLAMNVLAPWPRQSARRHIARVSSAFRGAFGMPVPVPYVASMLFEQLADDAEAGGVTLHDATARLDALVADLGYRGEIEDNIRASLGLRLRLLLQPRRAERVAGVSAPEWLVDRPTLIQLGDLGDDEERAFLAAMLVLYVADAARARGGSSRVQHVTVIEEAHRLMPEPRSVASEDGDAGAVASRLMAQLLAEIRGHGESVLVVDQSPAAVAREVIRNTSMKLAHRVVDIDDQRVLGGALGLTEEEQPMLGALTPGRCLISTKTLLRPQAVGVERLPEHPGGGSSFVAVPTHDASCHRSEAARRHHVSEGHGAQAELLIGLWAADDRSWDPVEALQRIVRIDPLAMPSCLVAIGIRRYVAGLGRAGQLAARDAAAHGAALHRAAMEGSAPPPHPAAGVLGPLTGCDACARTCRARSLVLSGVVPGQRGLSASVDRAGRPELAVRVLEDRMDDTIAELEQTVSAETAEAFGLCVALHAATAAGLARRFTTVGETKP